MNMEHTDIPLTDAAATRELVRTRQVSPVEVVRRALDRAAEVDLKLNIFVTLTEELALDAARSAERAILRDEPLGPLAGVPITVKDNLNIEGIPTTSGSKILKDNIAGADSPAVARAKAAGACILGKTTLPEFATKGVGDSPLTGISRNPWDVTKTPGGSSAGGAAGTAAGVSPLALVTDGGGSARLPASFCGVLGLKPQFGRIPYVPISATPSMSHVGIISNSVADAALMLNVLAGGDLRDPAAIPGAHTPIGELADTKGLRIAWSPTLGFASPNPEVLEAVQRAVRVFADELGCEVDEVEAPFLDPSPIWESEFLAGAGAKLAPLVEAHGAVMDPAVVAQLAQGRAQTLDEYFTKVAERYAFRERVRALFEDYDLLITPTLPVTAFDVGHNTPPGLDDVDAADLLGWIKYLSAFNVTGNPAASVPCGFSALGLPIGMQIVGRAFEEETVLRAAARFEAVRPWASRRAPVS